MVLVETTVWVDYFRGVGNPETDWLDSSLDRQRLGITDGTLRCCIGIGTSIPSRHFSSFPSSTPDGCPVVSYLRPRPLMKAMQARQHFRRVFSSSVLGMTCSRPVALCVYPAGANRCADRSLAFRASCSRFRGAAVVT